MSSPMSTSITSGDVSPTSEVLPCHFHLSGHCKFGYHCKFLHIPTSCDSISCSSPACSLRHPKPCKFFHNGFCRFGANCSYSHSPPNITTPSDILTKEITLLRDEVAGLKSQVALLSSCLEASNNTVKANALQCDICNYVASSHTVLKRHISMKHKLEVLRDSLSVSPDLLIEESSSLCVEPSPPQFFF